MTQLQLPAAKVVQGSLTLYATAVRVEHLVAEGFYSVETLDPARPGGKNFQRVLNAPRAKRLADYVIKGQAEQDAFLPTSVFLATDKHITFRADSNVIEFDTGDIGPFSVVDGQHRLEGLKIAAAQDSRVYNFMLPVTIAADLPKLHQMCHFLIVNTTQKSVDQSVEYAIMSRLTEALNVEELPTLPRWITRVVQTGEVDKAMKIVRFLNDHPESPWLGRISMPNDNKPNLMKSGSFVKSIVKYVLTANNPISVLADPEKERNILLNYWKAIVDLIDDGTGSAAVLFKYIGVELWCRFSIPFFTKLAEGGDYTVTTMKQVLQACLEHAEGASSGVGRSEWWVAGSTASNINAGAVGQIVQEMARALHGSRMSSDIIT